MPDLNGLIGIIEDLRARVAALEQRETRSIQQIVEEQQTLGLSAHQIDTFAGATLSTAWALAPAPFVTPTVSVGSGLVTVTNVAGAQRAFLYRSLVGTQALKQTAIGLYSSAVGFAAGLRLDDGSDTNYSEVVLRVSQSSPTQHTVQLRHRVAGGTVATFTSDALPVPLRENLVLAVQGTLWSDWYPTPLIYGASLGSVMFKPDIASTALTHHTWTPTRCGIVVDGGGSAAGWMSASCAFVAV